MSLQMVTIISEVGDKVLAKYNPNEFSIETRNQYQRTAMPGLPAPVTQFVSGEAQKLSFSLFFDSYEAGTDVRDETGKLTNLMRINSSLHTPPICTFQWGGRPMSGETKRDFVGVIDSISQKFTMFLDSGLPVRATLALSVTEYLPIEEQRKALKLESADRTKRRVLREGDTLWAMADREYEDPAQWRVIAEANNIDNPRTVSIGKELKLPPLE